jgi:SAM-dependent methyltransferase
MLSDGRVLDRPLAKADCARCGHVGHSETLTPEEISGYFGESYALYAHAPGRSEERSRQRAYAEWIAATADAPSSLLEVGCGNGSLLLELAALLPSTRAVGIDPSPRAVEHARKAGVVAYCGFAGEKELREQDLVLSVNVIEHTPDPVLFLRTLWALASPAGRVVVVCPDGQVPSAELLMFDHLSSMTEASFALLAGQAGLSVEDSRPAPAALGPFRMRRLKVGRAVEVPGGPLHEARAAYLEAWAGLDQALLERLDADSIACFGTGETAMLLRAYAPRTWARSRAFVVDHPWAAEFCGLPVLALDQFDASQSRVLLAVRPADQPSVARRVPGAVRWDDLIRS